MRMWLVNPKLLCRAHLLGEHKELHMLAGCMSRGKSITGFLYGLVEPTLLYERHAQLVAEMQSRNYNHQSPLPASLPIYATPYLTQQSVSPTLNLIELAKRCASCAERQQTNDPNSRV